MKRLQATSLAELVGMASLRGGRSVGAASSAVATRVAPWPGRASQAMTVVPNALNDEICIANQSFDIHCLGSNIFTQLPSGHRWPIFPRKLPELRHWHAGARGDPQGPHPRLAPESEGVTAAQFKVLIIVTQYQVDTRPNCVATSAGQRFDDPHARPPRAEVIVRNRCADDRRQVRLALTADGRAWPTACRKSALPP